MPLRRWAWSLKTLSKRRLKSRASSGSVSWTSLWTRASSITSLHPLPSTHLLRKSMPPGSQFLRFRPPKRNSTFFKWCLPAKMANLTFNSCTSSWRAVRTTLVASTDQTRLSLWASKRKIQPSSCRWSVTLTLTLQDLSTSTSCSPTSSCLNPRFPPSNKPRSSRVSLKTASSARKCSSQPNSGSKNRRALKICPNMSHLRGESLSRKPSLMSILRLWRAKKSHKCVLQTSQLLYAFLLRARTAKTSTTSYLCPLKMRRTDY